MVFKGFKKYTPLLLLIFLIGCKKTDWRENYKEKSKSPFGNYIVFNESKELFKDNSVTKINENIYDYLLFETDIDSTITYNYICLKHNGYKHTNEGITELLDFVSKGNNAFLAFNNFKDTLQSSLKFTTNNLDKNLYSIPKLKKLKGKFDFKNNRYSKTSYSFDRNIRRNYFLEFDEKTTNVLGSIEVDGEKVPNFIRIKHGKGSFYLHLHPIAFTNYYLIFNMIFSEVGSKLGLK